MRGTSLMLLGAVALAACISGHPYSKIADGTLLADGYHYKKSSSSSNSNSYSQSNEDNVEVSGVLGGQTYSGVKNSGYSTSGGSHSQSSSYSSGTLNGAVPIGLLGSSSQSYSGASSQPSPSEVGYGSLGHPGTGDLSLGGEVGSSSGSFSSSSFQPAETYGIKGGVATSFGSSSSGASNGFAQGSASSSASSNAQVGSNGNLYGLDASNGLSNSIGQTQSGQYQGVGQESSNVLDQSHISGHYGTSGSSQVSLGTVGQSGSSGYENAGSSQASLGTVGQSGSTGYGNAGPSQGSLQYWWNGPESPFGPNGRPSGGCSSNGCSASGTFDLGKGSGAAQGSSQGSHVAINIQGNPFLSQGSSGGKFSGSSSFGTTASSGSTHGVQSGHVNLSQNPFFGVGLAPRPFQPAPTAAGPSTASAGASSSASASSFASSSSNAQVPHVIGLENPFLQPGAGSGTTQLPHVPQTPTYPGTTGTAGIDVAPGNPFLRPGSGSSVVVPVIPLITPTSPGYDGAHSQQPAQIPIDQSQITQTPDFFGTNLVPDHSQQGRPDAEGGLTVSCSGAGRICVNKNLCHNGFVNTNGAGIMQVRSGIQQCDINRQVCCTIQGYSGVPTQVGIVHGVDFSSTSSAESSSYAGHEEGSHQSTHHGQEQSQEGQFDISSHGVQYTTQGPTGQSTIKTSFGNGAISGSQSGDGLIHVVGTKNPTATTIGNGLIHVTTSGTSDLFGHKSGSTYEQGVHKQTATSVFDQHVQTADKFGGDLNTGEPGYVYPNAGAENMPYLPPLGSDSSSNVPSFSQPPRENDGGASDADSKVLPPAAFPPAPEVPPQVGCAAALICVEEKFCTMGGVISTEPITLTSEQILRRVPLSTCKNPDNGIIGKCCRDPNYVDPWPTGNLPANYSGGFDEQGFPTFLNIAKTRPPKKPSTKTPQQTKPLQPTKTFSRPHFNLPQLPQLPVNPFLRPSHKPQVTTPAPEFSSPAPIPDTPPPTFLQIPTRPPVAPFPSLPDSSSGRKSPVKTSYHPDSSNQSPVFITPHTPGSQCGLKNKVQRPSDLSDVDVAFGEIPWQAMVLSNRDRKLLCSGAIVAPNVVVTAAHCVEGFGANEVSIKSGEWKLGYELKYEEPLPFEIVNVASIVPHPGYYSGGPSYDLAMLFLEHPLKLDQHVDTLCIGEQPQPQPGKKCIATGWGKTVLQVNVAGALMHGIDVDLLPSDECSQRVQNAESHIDFDETLVCAKPHLQSNNMCQVDVGGPLACDRGDGNYELTGVYSQDTGCLPTNQVATFALIDTDWIKKMMSSPPSNEVTPHSHEPYLPPRVEQHVESHSHVQQPCDCQKSELPSETNQYLPPV
ncbi:hornerin [Orussus abietinus]|uniref:hornerin n=1 Tax=Orussus abietinus TaxID=222816 RepID=UPI0006260625|nr:hornerin [Orussus abietinus]